MFLQSWAPTILVSPLCLAQRRQIYYFYYYHLFLLDCNLQEDPCPALTCNPTFSTVSYSLKEKQNGVQRPHFGNWPACVQIWDLIFPQVCGWASNSTYFWTSSTKHIIHLWDCCKDCRWMRSWPGAPRDCPKGSFVFPIAGSNSVFLGVSKVAWIVQKEGTNCFPLHTGVGNT